MSRDFVDVCGVLAAVQVSQEQNQEEASQAYIVTSQYTHIRSDSSQMKW